MRWPIQTQLLLPMLTVVVGAIALASLGSAYFGGLRARQVQEEHLDRVVATLTEARFPLTQPVLGQMSGLSGAEFVLLDQQGHPLAGTLSIDADELDSLRRIRDTSTEAGLSGQPSVALGGRSYLGRRVAVRGRELVASSRWLIVLYPEDRWAAAMRHAAYPALVAGGLAAAAIVLVTTALAHRFVRPIRQLGDRAAAIARGDFRPAAIGRHDDEIRDLAVSINRMAEQLGQYELRVRRHEQLKTLDRLGAGMAHQLRNAAAGARMAIELHQRGCKVADEETLAVALRQLRLMESYLQRFMALGQTSDAPPQRVDLASLVGEALSLVRPACFHAGIELGYHRPESEISVEGDPESLRQLTVNLAMNAVEAAARCNGGKPRIAVALDRAADGRARLQVCDSGPGPAAELADRLFEPFVSGKPEGTGLGLYVARQIVENHRGTIHWRRDNEQTCFTVTLPLATGLANSKTKAPPPGEETN